METFGHEREVKMKKSYILEIIDALLLILLAIWSCYCMIHGVHVQNIYETITGCTFWLYALISMQLRNIAMDVKTGAALAGLNYIHTSAADHGKDENDGCVD